MTRTELKKIGTQTRERYIATVGRMGIKNNDFKGFPERTILLLDVRKMKSNELVTDHLWFTVKKQLKDLKLKRDDKISFNARVSKYKKGYITKETDYKLNKMSKIIIESPAQRELEEGELTSDSEPSFKELFEAQKRARERNSHSSTNENENLLNEL